MITCLAIIILHQTIRPEYYPRPDCSLMEPCWAVSWTSLYPIGRGKQWLYYPVKRTRAKQEMERQVVLELERCMHWWGWLAACTTLVVTVTTTTMYRTDYRDEGETIPHMHIAYDTIQTSICVFLQVYTLIKYMYHLLHKQHIRDESTLC